MSPPNNKQNLESVLLLIRQAAAVLKWLVAGVAAIAVWQASVEWRLGAIQSIDHQQSVQILEMDRAGTTAQRIRDEAEAQILKSIAARLTTMETNTGGVQGMKADIEWIKSALQRMERTKP